MQIEAELKLCEENCLIKCFTINGNTRRVPIQQHFPTCYLKKCLLCCVITNAKKFRKTSSLPPTSFPSGNGPKMDATSESSASLSLRISSRYCLITFASASSYRFFNRSWIAYKSTCDVLFPFSVSVKSDSHFSRGAPGEWGSFRRTVCFISRQRLWCISVRERFFPSHYLGWIRLRKKRTGRIAVIQQPCDGVTYEYISKWPSVRWIEGGPSRLREEGEKDRYSTLPAHFTLPAGLSLSGLYTLDFLRCSRFPIQDSGAEVRAPRETNPGSPLPFSESLTTPTTSFIGGGVVGWKD